MYENSSLTMRTLDSVLRSLQSDVHLLSIIRLNMGESSFFEEKNEGDQGAIRQEQN